MLEGEARVENTGSGALRLTRVRPSCSCVHVLTYPGEVAEGGTGVVGFRVIPEKPGAFSHSLYVELQDSGAGKSVRQYELAGNAGETAPEALRRAAASISSSLLKVRRIDIACSRIAIAAALADYKDRRSLLLVDVGTAADFAQCHIPGTTNVPLFSLRASGIVTGRDVVLVSRGYLTPRLAEECQRLNSGGRAKSTAVLDGGLMAWATAGGPLEGPSTGLRALATLSCQEFYESRSVCDWRLLDVSTAQEALADLVLPGAEFAGGADAAVAWAAAVGRLAGGSGPPPVLVFNRTGDYGGIPAPRGGVAGANVLFLEGGWQGYLDFLTEQTALASRKGTVKTVAKGCKGCP